MGERRSWDFKAGRIRWFRGRTELVGMDAASKGRLEMETKSGADLQALAGAWTSNGTLL